MVILLYPLPFAAYCTDGFRKMTRLLQGTLSKAFQVEPIEFWHANFRRGHPELLHLLQRKVGDINFDLIFEYLMCAL